MRWTGLVMAGLLAFGLGCSGMLGAVGDLAGIELAMKMGDDAEHPADFPAAPPEGATPIFSVAAVTSGESVNLPEGVQLELDRSADYRTEMITYQVARDDLASRVTTARDQVAAAGFTEAELDASTEADVSLFEQADTLFLVMGPRNEEDEEAAMVFMRLRKVEADPSE